MQSIVGNMGEPLERGDEEYRDEETTTNVSHDLTTVGGEEGGEKLPVAQKRDQDEILEVRDYLAHPLNLRPCFRSRTVLEFRNHFLFRCDDSRQELSIYIQKSLPRVDSLAATILPQRFTHPSALTLSRNIVNASYNVYSICPKL